MKNLLMKPLLFALFALAICAINGKDTPPPSDTVATTAEQANAATEEQTNAATEEQTDAATEEQADAATEEQADVATEDASTDPVLEEMRNEKLPEDQINEMNTVFDKANDLLQKFANDANINEGKDVVNGDEISAELKSWLLDELKSDKNAPESDSKGRNVKAKETEDKILEDYAGYPFVTKERVKYMLDNKMSDKQIRKVFDDIIKNVEKLKSEQALYEKTSGLSKDNDADYVKQYQLWQLKRNRDEMGWKYPPKKDLKGKKSHESVGEFNELIDTNTESTGNTGKQILANLRKNKHAKAKGKKATKAAKATKGKKAAAAA